MGTSSLVEGVVRRMREELGGNAACIATGGLASILSPESISSKRWILT